MHRATSRSSEGFALASALLIVLLLAGFSIGMIYQVNQETQLMATDLENNQAYYAAEAAMEKMMVDLSGLYTSRLAPTVADVEGLNDPSYQPVISGVTYPNTSTLFPTTMANRLVRSDPSAQDPTKVREPTSFPSHWRSLLLEPEAWRSRWSVKSRWR